MERRARVGLRALLAGGGDGQSPTRGVPIGVEAIRGLLTGHKQWTFYWDRTPTRDRTRARRSRPPGDFEVTVRGDGFTFGGCWGFDESMTYDPDDREYPFKGRTGGTLLWLAPS